MDDVGFGINKDALTKLWLGSNRMLQNSVVWKKPSEEKQSINFVLPLTCEVSFFMSGSQKLSILNYKGKDVNLNLSFPICRIKKLDSLVF